MQTALIIAEFLAGVVLLFFGRRLFWLLLGVVGFQFGAGVVDQIFPGQPDWVHVTMSLLIGLSGVLFALFLQRLAYWLVGFLVGGFLVISGLRIWGSSLQYQFWPVFLIGGAFGLLLIVSMFDWGLIILSCLTGAFLILQNFKWNPLIAILVLAVLVIIGFEFQVRVLEREEE